MTSVHNSILRQGADWRRKFYLEDKQGNKIDLTGATAASQIRPKAESPVVLATPVVTINTDEGYIELYVSAATSSSMKLPALSKGRVIEGQVSATGYLAEYDVEVKYAEGTVRREVMGQICISPESTRLGATNG